jgi:hypothetical protein
MMAIDFTVIYPLSIKELSYSHPTPTANNVCLLSPQSPAKYLIKYFLPNLTGLLIKH